MRRSGSAGRVTVMVVCALALVGCRDNGLPDRNIPLQEAREREFRYSVYEASPTSAPIALGGRHWMRMASVENVPGRMLVQVGNSGGTLLFARRGEEAPYSRLYSPVATDRWVTYVRLN